MATGLQNKFDFAGIAVAGVVGATGGILSRSVGGKVGSLMKDPKTGATVERTTPSLSNSLISGGASSIAGAAARSLITGTSFGDNIIAVLPDVIGSTFGRMIADGIGGDMLLASKDGQEDVFEWLSRVSNVPSRLFRK
ncbi:MAG: hypothetical protein WDN24_15340 [Sphingomonas sp.]